MIFADQFKDVNAASKWICCVPFARKEIVRQLRKTSGIKEVYSFPAEEDPFSPSGLTEEVFMEVCGDALPQNIIQQRSGFGLGRKRWRRNN
ncbi:hypothetical protein D3C78_1139950 [compost metagenome]